jgi:hypothetical protein
MIEVPLINFIILHVLLVLGIALIITDTLQNRQSRRNKKNEQ